MDSRTLTSGDLHIESADRRSRCGIGFPDIFQVSKSVAVGHGAAGLALSTLESDFEDDQGAGVVVSEARGNADPERIGCVVAGIQFRLYTGKRSGAHRNGEFVCCADRADNRAIAATYGCGLAGRRRPHFRFCGAGSIRQFHGHCFPCRQR